MKVVANLLITAVAVLVGGYFLGGVTVASIWWAIGFAIILSIFNVILRPILQILSLPITFITLGLFALVVNGFVLYLATWFTGGGVQVASLWSAMIFAIVISLVSALLNWIFKTKE
jgi:putative membrane protein